MGRLWRMSLTYGAAHPATHSLVYRQSLCFSTAGWHDPVRSTQRRYPVTPLTTGSLASPASLEVVACIDHDIRDMNCWIPSRTPSGLGFSAHTSGSRPNVLCR